MTVNPILEMIAADNDRVVEELPTKGQADCGSGERSRAELLFRPDAPHSDQDHNHSQDGPHPKRILKHE